MDEHEHPRIASRAFGRKGKAVVPSEEEEEDKEQEEEDRAGTGTLQGAKDDNVVNLSNNKEYVRARVDKPPLTRAQLTSLVADVKVLVWKRNVIAPRTLFVEEPIVEAADPLSSRPIVETRMAKRAKQSHAGFVAEASLSTLDDDFQCCRIHNLEERLDKMNQSQLEM